jgi:hypothetical protein
MKPTFGILVVACLSFIAAAHAQKADKSTGNAGGCKVVQLKPGEQPPSGSMTSTVTAGGGRVSGSTTGGNNSVTVHSGNGSTSSSMVTTGSSGGSSTTVTSANGDCTIYVNPGRK